MNTRLASSALASAIFFLGGTSVKADWDYWGVKDVTESGITYNDLYTINSSNESATFIQRFCEDDSCLNSTGIPFWSKESRIGDRNHHIDDDTIVIKAKDSVGGDFKQYKYTLSGTNLTRGDEVNVSITPTSTEQEGGSAETFWHDDYHFYGARGSGSTINQNPNQNLAIGTTSITQKGLNIDGTNLIKKEGNGAIHIGENSLVTKEANGRQQLYSTNESGQAIPIDITNGTKLLINGRDVDQAIDNVGALSAALTGLPTVPQDSPLACGVGAGAHSGSNALSGGCASKINERLTFNAAASFIPANQEYQGTDNSWSGRAGFVFKLGKISKPTLISMKEKKGMQAKITELSTANNELQAKVDSFELEKAALVARLEKIEQIALANQKDEKIAFSFLNVSKLFSSMRSFLISSN